MSTIQIKFFNNSKTIYNYHVEVKFIIDGENSIIDFDFDRIFLLLY